MRLILFKDFVTLPIKKSLQYLVVNLCLPADVSNNCVYLYDISRTCCAALILYSQDVSVFSYCSIRRNCFIMTRRPCASCFQEALRCVAHSSETPSQSVRKQFLTSHVFLRFIYDTCSVYSSCHRVRNLGQHYK